MAKLTSIQVSAETHDRLYKMKSDLEKIVGRSLSFEDVIKILLLARPLEESIENLMLMVE